MQSPARKTAFLSLAVALGMILSYVEVLVPLSFGIPGMKPGLCNILVLFLIFSYGAKEALVVNLIRIVLTGLLFGNPYSIAYSLAGAVLSFVVMLVLIKTKAFSAYGISMAGGISHNLGQILVAMYLVQNYRVILYFPALVISGCVTGFIVAFLAIQMIKRVGRVTAGNER